MGILPRSVFFFTFFFFAFLQYLFNPPAHAVDILNSAETVFFEREDKTRLGIEVEFTGLSPREAAQKVQSILGGKIVTKEERIKTSIRSLDSLNRPVYDEIIISEFEVVDTQIGTILLKPETNQIDDIQYLENNNQIIELVTEPIRYNEVEKLDLALDELKKAGAHGTDTKTPISIQVNVEMFDGQREKIKLSEILNLLRSYLRPEHTKQITARLDIPEIRKPYISEYSTGFMRRLLDPSYRPTIREFYDDFIYRQSLEFLGNATAWSDPIEKVKGDLLKNFNPVVPQVVKQNRIRISSLLMWMLPDDPMSRIYQETGWAVARPIVEFREWNNEFNATQPVRQALGLKKATEKFGYFDHDHLLSELTGVNIESFPKLREIVNRSRKTGEIITFRYFLGNFYTIQSSPYLAHFSAYESDPVGYLSHDRYGIVPLMIPGESIVIHRMPNHQKSVLGKYNPNLSNLYIRQILENKYAEYLFFEDFTPNLMPKTDLLSHVIGHLNSPIEIERHLRTKYPNGYMIKNVWDLSSERKIITDESHFSDLIASYQKSDFNEYAASLRSDQSRVEGSPDLWVEKLKEHPDYLGWKIYQMLSNPSQSIIQAKVDIAKEFRIEILGGRVIGGKSTIERFYYEPSNKEEDHDYRTSAELIKNAEKFAQTILDQLPSRLRSTPMSMDVAILRNGRWVMIESNMGGNSSFLFEENPESIRTLTSYLRQYIQRIKSGQIPEVMSNQEQMEFIEQKFKQWKIDVSSQFPGFRFLKDRIEDSEYQVVQPDFKKIQISAEGGTLGNCEDLFQAQARGSSF